jgi:hypothetical protein
MVVGPLRDRGSRYASERIRTHLKATDGARVVLVKGSRVAKLAASVSFRASIDGANVQAGGDLFRYLSMSFPAKEVLPPLSRVRLRSSILLILSFFHSLAFFLRSSYSALSSYLWLLLPFALHIREGFPTLACESVLMAAVATACANLPDNVAPVESLNSTAGLGGPSVGWDPVYQLARVKSSLSVVVALSGVFGLSLAALLPSYYSSSLSILVAGRSDPALFPSPLTVLRAGSSNHPVCHLLTASISLAGPLAAEGDASHGDRVPLRLVHRALVAPLGRHQESGRLATILIIISNTPRGGRRAAGEGGDDPPPHAAGVAAGRGRR